MQKYIQAINVETVYPHEYEIRQHTHVQQAMLCMTAFTRRRHDMQHAHLYSSKYVHFNAMSHAHTFQCLNRSSHDRAQVNETGRRSHSLSQIQCSLQFHFHTSHNSLPHQYSANHQTTPKRANIQATTTYIINVCPSTSHLMFQVQKPQHPNHNDN